MHVVYKDLVRESEREQMVSSPPDGLATRRCESGEILGLAFFLRFPSRACWPSFIFSPVICHERELFSA